MASPAEKKKLLFYDSIADQFDIVVMRYDLNRRLEIVFGELLADAEVAGRALLDVGCGTGWFSRRAIELGADVVALDIGCELLKKVRLKCEADVVAADACALPFVDDSFDIVLASESIEHTLDPKLALSELYRVLRPGGTLVVTVPNQIWHFTATVASILKVRSHEGYENWIGWFELRRELARLNAGIEKMFGFHIVPPIVPRTERLIRYFDRFGGRMGPIMLNIAVRATKACRCA
jgi:ubiquinone/menaquinone biosynthesis C-methylase UbiE